MRDTLSKPESLKIKPEDVDTPEKRANYTVSVVGCGHDGILVSVAFAEAGFKVICIDANQEIAKRLGKGKSTAVDTETEVKLRSLTKKGKISATSEMKTAVSQSDVVVLAGTIIINEKKKPDYSETETICKQVGTTLRPGTVVIYCGIAGYGFTEGVVKENIENASGFKVGQDFGLAYYPRLPSDDKTSELIGNEDVKVAAIEKTSLDSGAVFLGTITKKGVKKLTNIKDAELAVLFAAAQMEINTALANELGILCENLGQDCFEIIKLLDRNGLNSSVSPTFSNENIINATYLLLAAAENLEIELRLPALAIQINENMIKHAVNLTQEALRSCGKTLRRARIALLGSPKPNTAAYTFSKMLESRGARITIYEPRLEEKENADSAPSLKKTLNETVEGTDCIVILESQDQFKRLNFKKLRAAMKNPAAIIDLAGIIDQEKVEKGDFIYRSIGKG
jgi:nucleotide sugar dehydrogenase